MGSCQVNQGVGETIYARPLMSSAGNAMVPVCIEWNNGNCQRPKCTHLHQCLTCGDSTREANASKSQTCIELANSTLLHIIAESRSHLLFHVYIAGLIYPMYAFMFGAGLLHLMYCYIMLQSLLISGHLMSSF